MDSSKLTAAAKAYTQLTKLFTTVSDLRDAFDANQTYDNAPEMNRSTEKATRPEIRKMMNIINQNINILTS